MTTQDRSQGTTLFTQDEKLTRMLKALGNPVRFHIVQTLAEKKMCITGEIVEFTSLAQSTVSQHLKVLRDADLIKGEIEGPATCYCLNEQGIRWLKEQIGNWLPQCCQDINNEDLKRSLKDVC